MPAACRFDAPAPRANVTEAMTDLLTALLAVAALDSAALDSTLHTPEPASPARPARRASHAPT